MRDPGEKEVMIEAEVGLMQGRGKEGKQSPEIWKREVLPWGLKDKCTLLTP